MQASETALAAVRPTAPRVRVTSLAGKRAPHPVAVGSSKADTAQQSQQVDPFDQLYQANLALHPPFSFASLMQLYDVSDALQSAVSAMEVNIAGFGLSLVPACDIPDDKREEAEAEKRRIEAWFRYSSSEPWVAVRRRTRVDMEVLGDGYWEVLRNRRGEVAGIEHARGYWMRKGAIDRTPVEIKQPVRDPQTGEWTRIPVMRRFRRYVQVVNGTYTWFKEFGDPRKVNANNGEVDESLPDGSPDLATEVLCFSLYAPDSAYGKPRWRGAATDVMGRTAAGEVNSDTFDNNAIPPWLITVGGTLLGDAAVKRIQEHFTGVRGRENRHAPLVIEAAPDVGSGMPGEGPQPPITIGVKEMQSTSDAQFVKYRAEAQQSIRAAFRMPALFVGLSNDYSRATAEAAQEVGEEQVFAPERALEDEIINRRIMPELNARWWEVKGNGAPLLSEDTIVKMLEVGIKGGALSPEMVARILDPIFAQDITRKEKWAKLPTLVLESLLKAGWSIDEAEGLTKPATPPPPPSAQSPGSGAGGADAGGSAASTEPVDAAGDTSGQPDATEAQDGQAEPADAQDGRSHARALTRAEQRTGVMLALVPPPDVAAALALSGEGAEDPAQMHVTLAFFGDASELTEEQRARIETVAAFSALTSPGGGPIEGVFGGVARFSGAEGADDAVVLTLDAPGLETWRERLVEALRAVGCAPSAAHGFVPHMTVAYVAADAPAPLDRIDRSEATAVKFGTLELWVAGERKVWTLGG